MVQILARHAATAGISLVAGLIAAGPHRIDLVPVLQQLALEIIGSAMFSLEMNRYGPEMRRLILLYAASLGRSTLCFRCKSRHRTTYFGGAFGSVG